MYQKLKSKHLPPIWYVFFYIYLHFEIHHKSPYNLRFGPAKVLEKSLVLIHQYLWEPCTGVTSPTENHFLLTVCDLDSHFPGDICPEGNYCEEGSMAGTGCPPGTFLNNTGAQSVAACISCVAGSYCPGAGNAEPMGLCTQGYYCPSGMMEPAPAQYICPTGEYIWLKYGQWICIYVKVMGVSPIWGQAFYTHLSVQNECCSPRRISISNVNNTKNRVSVGVYWWVI